MDQLILDAENAEFWQELIAPVWSMLGITEKTLETLRKIDESY